jgi:Holliday junction resolvasome RuvABC endonuclease subunit
MSNRIVILGVDPGFANIGLMATRVYAGGRREAKSVHFIRTTPASKKLRLRQMDDNTRRLEEIRIAFRQIIAEVCPNVVAIEQVPRLRNPAAGRQCALGWAAMYTVARENGLPVFVYTDGDIKVRVCDNKKASKADMVKALKEEIFPTFSDWPDTARVEHICDAGGAALCAESEPAIELLLQER